MLDEVITIDARRPGAADFSEGGCNTGGGHRLVERIRVADLPCVGPECDQRLLRPLVTLLGPVAQTNEPGFAVAQVVARLLERLGSNLSYNFV